MHATRPQAVQNTLLAQRHALQGCVISKHRDHDTTRLNNIARMRAAPGTSAYQRLGFTRVAIIHEQRVTCLAYTLRHSLAHHTQTNESNSFAHVSRFLLYNHFITSTPTSYHTRL